MEEKRFWKGFIFGILSVVGLLALTIMIRRWSLPNSLTLRQEVEVLLKLNQMSSLIDSYYLEDVETSDLLEGAYAGFANAVGDKYTKYYTEEEFDAYMQDATGTYAGIGVVVTWDEEKQMMEILIVNEGSAAEKGGMLAGDLVYSVDGEVVTNTSMEYVTAKVRGKEGTVVTIGVIREGSEDPIELAITRELLEENTVYSAMLENGVGYLAIYRFDEITKKQFKEALESLQEQEMKGMILDLRGNPGGRLNVVVDIADQILPEGIITYTLTKSGKREDFTSEAETVLDIPMVVLIDENSASASEILAGAIKDYQAATLVGTQTFGKGIVQTAYSMTDGSGLKITMARYYTPDGNYIHGVGIAPDIVVELPVDKMLDEIRGTADDTQFTAALAELQKLIQE